MTLLGRHCEERSDEAISSLFFMGLPRTLRVLAMTHTFVIASEAKQSRHCERSEAITLPRFTAASQ
jgi:hypothetical protein